MDSDHMRAILCNKLAGGNTADAVVAG